MGQLLAYSLTSSILLACMYLAYKWVLSSENYHKVNRLVLWLIYIAAMGFPSLWRWLSGILSVKSVDSAMAIDINLEAFPLEFVEEQSSPWDVCLSILVWVYMAGMAVVTIMTVFNFIRLHKVIHNGEKISIDGRDVILTEDESIAPFSFCRTIVIPRKDFEQYGPMIMLHEKSHVEFCHWLDLLFAQAVCVLQWFNPAAWLMREELKTIHEYQADDRVISSGVNVKEYQMLLIKKAVGARFPSLANSLNHSKLKKRITMMYNQKTSRRRALRPLLLLPAIGAAFWISQLPAVASALSAVSSTQLGSLESIDKVNENPADGQISVIPLPAVKGRVNTVTVSTVSSSAAGTTVEMASSSSDSDKEDKADETASAVQQMPEYPGGMRAMMDYIIANIERPEGTDDINGRVVLKFVVEKDGSIGDVQVIRSLDSRLDAEAIRVVKSFPKWTPGMSNGKPVAVWYALPVNFCTVGDDTKAIADGSTSTSVSTSVSTDESGKSSTWSGVSVKQNGETIHFLLSPDGMPDNVVYYVNGERYEGDLKSIPATDIESMSIDKSNKAETVIRIELKKK